MSDPTRPVPEWTDEQAADATIEVLSEDFTVATLRSWFKPDPNPEYAGMSEWVSRADHARGMLQVGRALLTLTEQRDSARTANAELGLSNVELRGELAEARRERDEARNVEQQALRRAKVAEAGWKARTVALQAFVAWHPDCAQLLAGWHADGTAWTQWDQSVYDRLGGLRTLVDSALKNNDDPCAALSPPAPPLNIVGESVRPDDSDPRGGEVSTDVRALLVKAAEVGADSAYENASDYAQEDEDGRRKWAEGIADSLLAPPSGSTPTPEGPLSTSTAPPEKGGPE